MKTIEYQTGTATATQVEKGWLGTWFAERTAQGWKLKTIERYFSKEYQEDCFMWILERAFSSLTQTIKSN